MRIRDDPDEEDPVVEIRAPVPKHLHDRLRAEKQLTDMDIKDIVKEALEERYDLGEPSTEDTT